jgi:hypothetical protein
MFGLREIFPKLRLGDVEELDGCVVVLPTMGHLHGEVENRDAPNQSFELRTFLLSGWIGDYVR